MMAEKNGDTVQPTTLELRRKKRQDEIILAARACFRASGFHGASMSQIASRSQLSVGQIYRYFPNKDAIIEEIIRRIIDNRIAEIQGKLETSRLVEALAWRQTLNEEDDTLMLEMAAEATRNPAVAQMLTEADDRMFINACAQQKRATPWLTDAHIRGCVEVLAVMMEGTIYRRLSPPKVPAEELKKIYQDIIDMLFAKK